MTFVRRRPGEEDTRSKAEIGHVQESQVESSATFRQRIGGNTEQSPVTLLTKTTNRARSLPPRALSRSEHEQPGTQQPCHRKLAQGRAVAQGRACSGGE